MVTIFLGCTTVALYILGSWQGKAEARDAKAELRDRIANYTTK